MRQYFASNGAGRLKTFLDGLTKLSAETGVWLTTPGDNVFAIEDEEYDSEFGLGINDTGESRYYDAGFGE